ncbi:MAG: ABC transporter ATP-binding protein [Treponema sp.]|nr:ABC transporter ATP-binding protein [Treponema sp.]
MSEPGKSGEMSEPRKIGEVFLAGKNLVREFGHGDNKTIAVNNVDFEFRRGEIISIVGESGSGKTTLAKMILGLLNPTRGEIYYEGKLRDISSHAKRRLYWQNIQAIFQDPYSTYNIFHKIDSVLLDCIRLQGGGNLSPGEKTEKMKVACNFVNLKFEELSNKYPFELSGGQMQRLMIARIFMLHPRLLIADEPTSMIDACSRATILDMLLKLRDEINMTIVFITHDMGLAYYISDTVYIMEKGKIVERGSADEAILNPKSDYTKRLLGDVPKIYEPWDFSSPEEKSRDVSQSS